MPCQTRDVVALRIMTDMDPEWASASVIKENVCRRRGRRWMIFLLSSRTVVMDDVERCDFCCSSKRSTRDTRVLDSSTGDVMFML